MESELIEARIKEAEGQIGVWSEQAQYAVEKVAEWRGALQALRRLKADSEKQEGSAPGERVYTVDEVGA